MLVPIERLEVSRVIAAAAAADIFQVLRDPQGHVAIDSSGMLMGASGETVGCVGDTFVVHMDGRAREKFPLEHYDVTIEIVDFVTNRSIGWTVVGPLKPPIGHTYGYQLKPLPGATEVNAYYDWSTLHPDWRAKGGMPILDASTLRATLGILERTVSARRS
jgi:hypothetical protein